jgi:ribosomal protein S18 acetylase RimI-like enzyme
MTLSTISIRPYVDEDRSALLAILSQHIPSFFSPHEVDDYAHYLDHEVEEYWVATTATGVVGAGGINRGPQAHMARFSWDLVHPNWQGRGVGTRLMQHRMDALSARPDLKVVMVRTSQLAYPFYHRFGFHVQQIIPGYWGAGFDLYQMSLAWEGAA